MTTIAASIFLRSLFEAALAAADPEVCLPPFLPSPPRGRTVVVGAGKAAAAMARAVERHWPGELEGFVVTRYGFGLPCERIEVIEAAHPVPDAASVAAAQRALALVSALTADDLVLALISGGGSALMTLPAPGISLAEKQARTRELLRSGASIREINAERKRLSAIKGGKLAAAAMPARVVTLAISDIPGDDPADIASGPTVPAPGDPGAANCDTRLIATAMTSLRAAAAVAQAAGVTPFILGDAIEGEARQVACAMAADALSRSAPCVLISGGETTVTVTGGGRGGRNTEFLLALAIALNGAPRVSAIACDTDGIDGSEENAGAQVRPDTLARARAMGLDPAAFLADNNAYEFFAALGDLVVTGPTHTNVNDFRAILIQ